MQVYSTDKVSNIYTLIFSMYFEAREESYDCHQPYPVKTNTIMFLIKQQYGLNDVLNKIAANSLPSNTDIFEHMPYNKQL